MTFDWIEEIVDPQTVLTLSRFVTITCGQEDGHTWNARTRVDVFERSEVEGEGEFCWTNKEELVIKVILPDTITKQKRLSQIELLVDM